MDSTVNQTIDQINRTNLGITLAIIFTLLLIVVAATILAVIQQRGLKCPTCGNWRHNKASGVQSVSTVDGSKTTFTTQQFVVCKKCKNEFAV